MSSDVSSVSKQARKPYGNSVNKLPSNSYSAAGIEAQISTVHSPIYNQMQEAQTSPEQHSKQPHAYQVLNYNSNQPKMNQALNMSRRSVSNYSAKSNQAPKMAQFMTAISSVPAIPGKNQRILVNKQRGVSSSKSANRIFNRASYAPKRQNDVTYENGGQFSSFMSQSSQLQATNRSNKSFGTSTKRFDAKFDMKELFNREPGPGAYSMTTADSTMGATSSSQSTQGFGNGFISKTDRFKHMVNEAACDPSIFVGPGQYDPKILEKHINVTKFDAKTGFTLPFNERNPLNYVRPITVNIYFKQANPGVGSYDPEKVYKNVPACQNVFQSQVDRNANIRKLLQAANEPAPNSYDHQFGFDLVEYDRDKGTQPFRQPNPRKIVPINMYNPHGDVDVQDFKHQGVPGPGKYNNPTQFPTKEGTELDKIYPYTGGKVYVENTMDRFGQQIMPRKPRDLFPGPGEYNLTPRVNIDDPLLTKGGYLAQQETKDILGIKEKGVPGPAFYNPAVEPKKISFLFNAAEKWTN